MKENNRIGEENINTQGCKMKIIEYRSSLDIDVQFEDGNKVYNKSYGSFKRGNIKNYYYPNIFGVACLGNEKCFNNGKLTKEYVCWHGMIERCYSENSLKQKPTYENCVVCDEWLCFENFKKWYDVNFYQVDNEVMSLDKDILNKGNKIYSPNTCVFVPQTINTLFVKRDKSRGKYPIGITEGKYSYQVRMNIGGKVIHLGNFNTIEESFNCYKENKEAYIKEMAEKYKNKIPMKLYEAMINYKVEIND